MARPRSERAHKQVLNAALDLFAERGIDATSMDSIAEASGVSKATIYKHWSDKDALCLEAIAHLHGMDRDAPMEETGDLRTDIAALLAFQPGEQRSELRTRILPHLLAYAARNPAFGKAWRARILGPQYKHLIRLLKRGAAQGKLVPDLDVDLAAALLLGPMMYQHMMTLIDVKTPEDLPDRVVASFWKSHSKGRERKGAAITSHRKSRTSAA